jgi:hypothetical protein
MFVDRRDGVIVACYGIQQHEGHEELADDAADLVAFLERINNPVPQAASSGDFMRALYELGWYDNAKAAVEMAGGLAKILWDRAATFERQHPMVAQISQAIGKNSDDLDELFRRAATYTQA